MLSNIINHSIIILFTGQTRIYVTIRNPEENTTERSNESLNVTILRPQRLIDRLFTFSVIILVSILYINFGAALNLETIKEILRRPVGPIICFVCQFVLMPLTSFGLGFLLFPTAHEMALGLFFTGISPGGGASNMWTLLLGGNIHLSIAMTTISTIAAFGMMPLWIFTLGKLIFDRANLGVPYSKIFMMAFGLVIPLAIGLLIQRFLPRLARLLVRVLKPVSMILILFIIVFAIITNFYIFQLFSWQVSCTILFFDMIRKNEMMKKNIYDFVTRLSSLELASHGWAIHSVGYHQRYFDNHHLIALQSLLRLEFKIQALPFSY